MRFQPISAGMAFALSAFFASSASGAALSDAPAAPSQKPSTVHFDGYACDAVTAASMSTHIGQVIGGSYKEWIQNADANGGVTCITLIKPQARQLDRATAEAFITASLNISASVTGPADSPADSNAENVASDSPAQQNNVLPVGISPAAKSTADAPVDGTASTASSDALAATQPQLLNPPSNDHYAIMDLGYGKQLAEKKKPADAQPERPATIGTDDRIRVNDKTLPPWSLIGQLIVTWKDGTQTVCTGTLVSQYVVLSAGQCGHNRDHGGFPSKVSFAPGQSQGSGGAAVVLPAGIRYADYVETNNRWTQVSGGQTIQTLDARSDYAAFYFATPWNASTFMPIVYNDTTTGTANTAGYPTDALNSQGINQDMWYSSGGETSRSVTLLRSFQVREFNMDVSAGENGAPIWSFDGTTRKMIGIVSYGGDDIAGGVWFGGENQSIISGFAGWTPAQSGPNHVADTLHVPYAIPSGDLNSDSYIRLYNPTAQAGAVTITFADADSGQTLGTWNSPSLPPFTSLQFYVKDMEPAANPAFTSDGHARYTLSMNANFPGFFQHVIWNRGGVSLTNTSGCGNGISNDVIHMNNVHSSLFTDYPSVILAHNVGTKAADAILGVYDAQTGARLGGVIIPSIPPNASVAFKMNEVESALNFTPAPGQFHYNLVQEGDFPGYLQHLVYNTKAGLITNMTAKCAFPLH